jgi:1-acyl-sn-glycerol-3-phosphate acyltransferase
MAATEPASGLSAQAGSDREERNAELARRFRPNLLSALQARRIKLWLTLVSKWPLRFNIEVSGLGNVPAGEPLIVAAAPHRNWIDPFLILAAMPALPRLFFIAAEDTAGQRWWKRLLVNIAGGMVPVTSRGGLNREGLALALAILESGNSVGIFPEGWGPKPDLDIMPLKRGVAFLSEHSGRRVLPVAVSGTLDYGRGATLRVEIAPPLPALPPGSDRNAEQAFVDRLQDVLVASVPPQPPKPADGRKPWRWLTHLM